MHASIISNSISILNIFEYYYLIPPTRAESKSPVDGQTQATVFVVRTSTGILVGTTYNPASMPAIIRNFIMIRIFWIIYKSAQNNDVEGTRTYNNDE